MFLPFSPRAKKWEPIAMELRRLGRADSKILLDPFALAPRVGLKVVDWGFATKNFSDEERSHLLAAGWSGGVLATPLRDGLRVCIINPNHSKRRNKVTLMEEISHIFLKHVPTEVRKQADGLAVRDYNQSQEMEAYGVGAAALLPWATFYRALDAGRSVFELAEHYDVTPELIQYRIKITAASKLYASRQKIRTLAAGA